MAEPAFPLSPAAFKGQSRVVDPGACFDWLRQGWAIFSALPGLWVGMTALFLFFLLAPVIVPLVGVLAAGLLLPLLAAGMLQACRQSAEGRDPALTDLFVAFQRQGSALVILGALNMGGVLALALLLALVSGGGALLGAALPHGGLGVALGGMMLMGLLAVLLSIPLAMAFLFAPALVLFHAMVPVAALQASFGACLKNWLVFLVFGLLLSILVFFAALPVGLGFLVLLPVLFGALYAAYRDIFLGV